MDGCKVTGRFLGNIEPNCIYQGHCMDILRMIPDESIHTCVTSPPYWGLRNYETQPQIWDGNASCEHEWTSTLPRRKRKKDDVIDNSNKQNSNQDANHKLPETQTCIKCGAWYGELGLEPTPEMYVKHMVLIFREVRRVLKSEGTLWLNLGDSYWGGKGRSTQNSPEVQVTRADISLNKPYHHIGGKGNTRPQDGRHDVLKPKDLVGIPWRIAFAMQENGWYLRSDIIWHKPNAMPESVKDRPTRAHEFIFLLAKSQRYYYDIDAIREPHKVISFQRQERAISNKHKNIHGAPGQPAHGVLRPRPNLKGLRTALEAMDNGQGLHPLGRNKRSVWTVTTKPFRGAHFATFPPELIEPCVLAGCPEEGIVLDPFFGAGTTGIVAMKNNRNFIGIELNTHYVEIANQRFKDFKD